MKRRDFLRTAASAAGMALLARSKIGRARPRGLPFVTPASDPVPGIIEIGRTRQVFLDDLVVSQASEIFKFVGRPQKYLGNPILKADRPWEQGRTGSGKTEDTGVEIFGQAVIYDEEEKIFKIWYLPWVWPDRRRPWCYATSRDGYDWEKPNLGIIEYNGSKENNLIGAWEKDNYDNVIKDSQEKDPSRRYKALGKVTDSNHRVAVGVAFSPDGIHWTPYEGNPVVQHGREVADGPTILGWDSKRRKYVYYPRPGHPLAGEIYGDGDHRHIRDIGYSESDDFIHWSPLQLMLTPDSEDRGDYQYMIFDAAIDGEFYIGLNAMHETHEQTWDIFLMSSRDGFHWNWIDRDVPFLGRGEVGTYDAGYMTPSSPIFHDGKVWIYYGCFSGGHSENLTKLGPVDRMAVALCTLPENRWMGLLAGPNRGSLVTRPLLFTGSKLIVDLDASTPLQLPRNPPRFDECQVRAALEDQSGGPIEGFSVEHSRVLTRSGPQELAWEGADVGRLAGQPVRIRFEMRNACLYSFQFA